MANTKLPYYKQQHDYSCGPACLRMAFAYYGLRMPERKIARIAGTSARGGTPRKSMIKTCLRNGFSFMSCENASLSDIRNFLNRGLPVIVNYIEPKDQDDHYAIAVKVGKRFVILNDPWNGRSFRITKQEFLERWWGWRNDGKGRIRRWLMIVLDKNN